MERIDDYQSYSTLTYFVPAIAIGYKYIYVYVLLFTQLVKTSVNRLPEVESVSGEDWMQVLYGAALAFRSKCI